MRHIVAMAILSGCVVAHGKTIRTEDGRLALSFNSDSTQTIARAVLQISNSVARFNIILTTQEIESLSSVLEPFTSEFTSDLKDISERIISDRQVYGNKPRRHPLPRKGEHSE